MIWQGFPTKYPFNISAFLSLWSREEIFGQSPGWQAHLTKRSVLAILAVTLASLNGCSQISVSPSESDWERLQELGITKEEFKTLPIDQQLEVFIDVAPYSLSHPDEALLWMADVIGDRGAEAVEPVVITIRVYLPRARAGDITAERVVSFLPESLYWATEFRSAGLRGTIAQTLIEELACDPRNSGLAFQGYSDALLLNKVYPEIPLNQTPSDKWTIETCKALGLVPP